TLAMSADGIGFILLRPDCDGDCDVTLAWTGPPDLKLCAFISGLALGVAVVLLIVNPSSSPWAKHL
ncbi:MAG TPA: hypothetical protein VKR61_20950, partial [Bryobacteraceae bacterium]|nr:hypothetical protein [Bryobacteraceae bacterium]